MSLTRKRLLATKRRQAALELKAKNRDAFVRKQLRRNKIDCAHLNPETECFRGYDVYVAALFPVHQCRVGVVAGCASCKHAELGFQQIKNGQTENLAFKCRESAQPKLWILQPDETLITGPGVWRVPRAKPLVDSHGHVIQQRPRPAPPGIIEPGPNTFSLEPQVSIWADVDISALPHSAIQETINRFDAGLRELLNRAWQQGRLRTRVDQYHNIEFWTEGDEPLSLETPPL